MSTKTLAPELLYKMHACWRAANYVSVGQIYLYDNPLLRSPLKLSDVKPLVVGHWGTVQGQNFIYVHLNRVIKKFDLNMFYIAGPATGERRWSAILISRAVTARSIQISAGTRKE
jgi:xylulose-5-phosphate/fructose-6-phosphate phosphoketolase